jgi:DNA replication factor GINS
LLLRSKFKLVASYIAPATRYNREHQHPFSSAMADSLAGSQIENVQDAHAIEFLNEEIRISYKKDVKLSVGEVSVDAREGDMSSLPRWLARILVQQGAVEIQSTDVAAYVSRSLNRERISRPHDLSGIDIDFYIRVNDYYQSLRERERESLVISLNTFVTSRLEKIVKLAAASPLSTELESKLAAEERELYNLVHKASTGFKKGVLKTLG